MGDLKQVGSLADSKAWNSRNFGIGFFVKLVLMAMVNALGVYVLWQAWHVGSWIVFVAMLLILVAANYTYFTVKHTVPAKYMFPGVAFLLVFQIFVIFYTGFIALTNYGDGNMLSNRDQAAVRILNNAAVRMPDSDQYPLSVLLKGSSVAFAVVKDGQAMVGSTDSPLEPAPGATISDGRVAEIPGWEVADIQQILANQQTVTTMRVPVSDDAEDGVLATSNGSTALVFKSPLTFDSASGTITDSVTGTVYTDNGRGRFASEDGQTLVPGWRVMVGVDNFTKAFSDERYAGPFLRVLLWTITFSILSVVTTFLLGLFLAIVFNEERQRGRKVYRTLLLLPYAFPGFLSALVWSGLLNRKFGFINQVLLGGAAVPWLEDPWLARLSVLGVNLWLGFPYMFLIATGALQALPGDIREAAKVDGAGPLRTWLSVTGPLVLISTAPVLIASFAFNFNNFTLIYMLTQGGPRFTDTSAPVGATDLLISMVYSISGVDGRAARDYGLASALSIIIFIVVGVVSGLGFRQTRKIEEVL